MKPRHVCRSEAALTLVEVAIVLAITVVLAALIIPAGKAARWKAAKISCTSNLKMVGMSYRIWAGDHGDMYPMGLSTTNGGSMEQALAGNPLSTFQLMSNELVSPLVLHCPADTRRFGTQSFAGLSNSNLSYFVAVDVTNASEPQLVLSGDCNLEVRGEAVKSGLLLLGTNDPATWAAMRHGNSGNLGLADGSVMGAPSNRLALYLEANGNSTNRLAIP